MRLSDTYSHDCRLRVYFGKESVLVSDIEAIGPGMYPGTIDGFRSVIAECEGYLLGQSVEFTEKQIFECSTP